MTNGTGTNSAGQALSVEDAELLASAHLELLEAQASGTQVLGSTDGAELVTAAHNLLNGLDDTLAAFDAQADTYDALTDSALASGETVFVSARRLDDLLIRRERRTTARVLRTRDAA